MPQGTDSSGITYRGKIIKLILISISDTVSHANLSSIVSVRNKLLKVLHNICISLLLLVWLFSQISCLVVGVYIYYFWKSYTFNLQFSILGIPWELGNLGRLRFFPCYHGDDDVSSSLWEAHWQSWSISQISYWSSYNEREWSNRGIWAWISYDRRVGDFREIKGVCHWWCNLSFLRAFSKWSGMALAAREVWY